MAENHITFHLVSPERKLASFDAKSVVIPGMEGDITLLPNHADFLTSLRPGILVVEDNVAAKEFLVTGGFVEVSESVVTVLAEKAVPMLEADKIFIEHFIEEAEEEVNNSTDGHKARADLRLNDLRTLAGLLN
jgi:F-type H+-transporting ATPase subunit epsilon